MHTPHPESPSDSECATNPDRRHIWPPDPEQPPRLQSGAGEPHKNIALLQPRGNPGIEKPDISQSNLRRYPPGHHAIPESRHPRAVNPRKSPHPLVRHAFALQTDPRKGRIDALQIATRIQFASQVEMMKGSADRLNDLKGRNRAISESKVDSILNGSASTIQNTRYRTLRHPYLVSKNPQNEQAK